jgi:hypothetical protein
MTVFCHVSSDVLTKGVQNQFLHLCTEEPLSLSFLYTEPAVERIWDLMLPRGKPDDLNCLSNFRVLWNTSGTC